jgi:hypothetical protein
MSRHFSYFSFKRSIALAAWLVNENLLGQVSPYHAKNEEINITGKVCSAEVKSSSLMKTHLDPLAPSPDT